MKPYIVRINNTTFVKDISDSGKVIPTNSKAEAKDFTNKVLADEFREQFMDEEGFSIIR